MSLISTGREESEDSEVNGIPEEIVMLLPSGERRSSFACLLRTDGQHAERIADSPTRRPGGSGCDRRRVPNFACMNENIDLWSERGVPRAQIINRIRQRSMADCLTAQQWLLQSMPDEMMSKMCHMDDGLRSTPRVMSFLPLHLLTPQPDGMAVESVIEIMALCVEAYVRASDECFPKASKN